MMSLNYVATYLTYVMTSVADVTMYAVDVMTSVADTNTYVADNLENCWILIVVIIGLPVQQNSPSTLFTKLTCNVMCRARN